MQAVHACYVCDALEQQQPLRPLCFSAGARARLSTLPDEERRAAAADMALKLSRMMGLGDDDDDGEGSGSEDSREGAATADDRQPQPDAVR